MLLVDGHNLIGQLQDLSLDDPYDEAKLTMAIKSYCMRSRSKATVIFDNGMPGGPSRELSNSDVKVIFAPHGVSADTLLMRKAREIGHSLVLVTSDRRILQLAFAYGIETLSSAEFAILIGFRPVEVDPDTAPEPGKPPEQRRITLVYEKDPNPIVTPDEIAYWLPIFERRLERARVARLARRQKRPRKS